MLSLKSNKGMDVKVSIIVPIYNVEKYLKRCMDSLLNQTLNDIEIIMVDDGSPDNCPQMCDDYLKTDSRIKVIHKKNAGLGYARNSGLDIARGEYVAFVDSDDYVDTDMYELLYQKAKSGQFDVVYSGVVKEWYGGKTSKSFISDKEYRGIQVVELLADMISPAPEVKEEGGFNFSVWTSIYKRDVIEKNEIRFQSEREIMSEDIVFHAELLPHCRSVCYYPDAFYHYCYNDNSLTHNFNPKKIAANFALYEMILKILKQNNLEYMRDRVMRLFMGYTRGIILRNILLSSVSLSEKKMMCREVYDYPGWKYIFSHYPIGKITFLRRMILMTIKYKLFYVEYFFFNMYYRSKH